MKHTPEPWRVEVVTTRGLPGPYITADLAGGGDIADLYILSEMDECIPKECAEANAARIVACVNACEGMDDPAAEIARLREAWPESAIQECNGLEANLREALDALMKMVDANRHLDATPTQDAAQYEAVTVLAKHGRPA